MQYMGLFVTHWNPYEQPSTDGFTLSAQWTEKKYSVMMHAVLMLHALAKIYCESL
jgi:hypothetical protein